MRSALWEGEMMIDQLEENLTLENYAEHMEEINRLARSRDASCRIRLADLLCGFPNLHAKDTLLALAATLSTIAHELTHYFQWINSLQLTPIGEERQAARYAGYILDEYAETREHP